MADPLLVSVAELEELAGELLAHIREVVGEEIDLSADYCWDIPVGTETAVFENAPIPDIGQYSEDLNWLRRMFAPDGISGGVGLIYLAAVLRRIGHLHPL